jgi:hypothetical protein
LTRFGGSLIITQLEIQTESQLALENEFFSDRHLSLLVAVRDYHQARDSNREPTCNGKIIFFSDRRLSPLDAVRGLSYYQPARDSKPDPTRPDLNSKFFFPSTPLPTRLFGALLLSPSSRFEPRANLHSKTNFFLIDALAHSTRFGALLLSTSSRFETRPDPTLIRNFFFHRRLCPLDCSGLSYYHPTRDSNREPTCTGKRIFF